MNRRPDALAFPRRSGEQEPTSGSRSKSKSRVAGSSPGALLLL
jgi:hypothetical protein